MNTEVEWGRNVCKIGWKSTLIEHEGITYRAWGENKEDGSCVVFVFSPALSVENINFDGVIFEDGPPFEVRID